MLSLAFLEAVVWGSGGGRAALPGHWTDGQAAQERYNAHAEEEEGCTGRQYGPLSPRQKLSRREQRSKSTLQRS